MQFEAASAKSLGHLKQHHQQVSRIKPLKRGVSFEAWKYGQMRAIGSRKPQGGRPGDTYTHYAGTDAGTNEEIQTIFGHAQVSFPLIS